MVKYWTLHFASLKTAPSKEFEPCDKLEQAQTLATLISWQEEKTIVLTSHLKSESLKINKKEIQCLAKTCAIYNKNMSCDSNHAACVMAGRTDGQYAMDERRGRLLIFSRI